MVIVLKGLTRSAEEVENHSLNYHMPSSHSYYYQNDGKIEFQRKFRENTFISERHEYIFTIASFQHWQLQTLFQHNLCWHYACRSS